MIVSGIEEDLRLVLETAEGLGVGDAVDIPLKAGADLALLLGVQPAPAVGNTLPLESEHFMALTLRSLSL